MKKEENEKMKKEEKDTNKHIDVCSPKQLCPTCKKVIKINDKNFPFCSKRCRMIDLNDWI